MIIAYVDGGSRASEQNAGYGVVLLDSGGNLIKNLYKSIGNQTNNFAEYAALIAALEYSVEHECDTLNVLSDSEVVVRQINGGYKVLSPNLIESHNKAKELISKLKSFTIQHIPREQNKEADRLANLAMDLKQDRRMADWPDVYEVDDKTGEIRVKQGAQCTRLQAEVERD